MRATPLPFSPPPIGDEEIEGVMAALRSGWITTGPRTRDFEKKFQEFTGAEAALAVNSGTAAMHIALAALGVKPGDAVITTALTFCCGVHVIEQVGARPVLVDVEPDTLNIDPAEVEKAAQSLKPGERLAAIMPVHLYGHSCERDELIRIARKYNCALVEDCAHSFPSGYKGRMIGAEEHAGVPILSAFSFYATKNLTTGEGGMLTGPADLVEEGRLWSLHGMSRDAWKRYQGTQGAWFYEVTRPGFKYNMTDIQAALGLAQLEKVRGFGVRRAEIAARYNKAFGAMEELTIPAHRAGIDHAWHVYSLRLNPGRLKISRAEFISELGRRNIAASVHFIPIHIHPYYRDRYGYREEDFPVAFGEYQKLVSLPIYPTMKDEDINDVIEAVRDLVTEHKHSAAGFATAQA